MSRMQHHAGVPNIEEDEPMSMSMSSSDRGDRENRDDSLVPEGVSLRVPSPVCSDDMDAYIVQKRNSFLERGPLFEGLEPRRAVSKKWLAFNQRIYMCFRVPCQAPPPMVWSPQTLAPGTPSHH